MKLKNENAGFWIFSMLDDKLINEKTSPLFCALK